MFIGYGMLIFALRNNIGLIIFGMILFGIIMGAHETIMRSAIADITPYNKRGTGYGVFNTGYGLALFLGASIMGLLYDLEMPILIIVFSISMEIIALILFRKLKDKVEI